MERHDRERDSDPRIGCFEVQNRMTDALDGLLSPKIRHAYDEHVSHCPDCRTQAEHLRELLRVLHHQPRATMPLELREDPLSFPIRRIRRFLANPRAVWKDLPVAVRLLVEGVSIAAVVVLGIRLGPVAREMYEARMEKRLQTMIAAEDSSTQSVPLARGRIEAEDGEPEELASSEGDSEGADNSAGVEVDSDVQVGKAEIWRFNLKTDAPAIVRGQILKALKDTGVPADTLGIGGVEAPGGIQFDLLVPQSVIAPLKAQLEHLAGKPSENLPFSETFTWYKNRSKKPIPNGMSRVVIWLSQI
ncbi:MAG: zf-HC2 domain-containing protein [Bdellovibrionales bacterium]|nr:zf-HC2 domain-containing protein [Bdellovibrionales bacterium]